MNTITRRKAITNSLLTMGSLVAPLTFAQSEYPARPVRLVIPYPPAGPTDSLGRLLAQKLSAIWKHPIIAENRPGAGGVIGAQHVATSKPDGYTLLFTAGAATGSSEVINPKNTPFRALQDFTPIMFIGVQPTLMVVQTSLPVKDLKEFVELAKANPGKFNYGNSATGSAGHFAFNMLKVMTGINVVEIPFAGSAPSNQAFAQGHVETIMGSLLSINPNLQTGQAKPIGVASSERMEGFPNVPTFKEQGFGIEWDTWYGVIGPAGMPIPLVEKISVDMVTALEGEQTRLQIDKMGITRRLGGRQRMYEALKTEVEQATKVAREAKMVKE
ncbi:MAG: tripartite tricarboxylate transporter substrate binding protein [Betaproteobacteria bacterium]|nr:tripartite tricarboxylate transporter substrate binding protein [Betaproteobacteria bacterium]